MTTNEPITRTVRFYLLHDPHDPDPTYRWQCRVNMSWVKDGDSEERQENGHGTTADEAYALARHIAAAFMYEDTIGSEEWPSNGIDVTLPPRNALDPRLQPVNDLMPAMDTDDFDDKERALAFALLAVDPKDPATLYWLAAVCTAHAAELSGYEPE